MISCKEVSLEKHLKAQAALRAIDENPANDVYRPERAAIVLPPSHIALLIGKKWGAKGVNLGVKFLDTNSSSLKRKILFYMNKWNNGQVNVQFRESPTGEVRITRTPGDGYWSYIGTDVLLIPSHMPTMNLDSFSIYTDEAEYDRVVCHEAGHTLGFPHEHARPEIVTLLDKDKTIKYFLNNYGWSAEETTEQVLTPLDPKKIQASAKADQMSIMTYQFDGECTKSGKPIPGGLKIDKIDFDTAAKFYPKQVLKEIPMTLEELVQTVKELVIAAKAGQWAKVFTLISTIVKEAGDILEAGYMPPKGALPARHPDLDAALTEFQQAMGQHMPLKMTPTPSGAAAGPAMPVHSNLPFDPALIGIIMDLVTRIVGMFNK